MPAYETINRKSPEASSFISQSSEFIGTATLGRIVSAWKQQRDQVGAMRALATMDDRSLADIGITRFDIVDRVTGCQKR